MVLSNNHNFHLTGKWYFERCSESAYGFVCQKPQGKIPSVSLSFGFILSPPVFHYPSESFSARLVFLCVAVRRLSYTYNLPPLYTEAESTFCWRGCQMLQTISVSGIQSLANIVRVSDEKTFFWAEFHRALKCTLNNTDLQFSPLFFRKI